MISGKSAIFFSLFLATSIGCAKIPCYPPDHYAPEPNAPYTAEEVRVPTSKGHILAGTLTLPTASSSPYPAVMMITGSGLQDRDHMQNKRKPVSYYKPFRQISDAISRKGIAVLRAEKEQELDKSIEGLNEAFSKGEGSPWIRSFLTYNPLHAAQKVSCPVLILHGDKDAHVPVNHAHILAKTMRISGNHDVTLKVFTNHNHLFLEDSDGRTSGYNTLLWHTNKLSENVLNTIAEWLSKYLAED